MGLEIKINRTWFFCLKNGAAAMNWGAGLAQDLNSGEFFRYADDDVNHALTNPELDRLVEARIVARYDDQQVACLDPVIVDVLLSHPAPFRDFGLNRRVAIAFDSSLNGCFQKGEIE